MVTAVFLHFTREGFIVVNLPQSNLPIFNIFIESLIRTRWLGPVADLIGIGSFLGTCLLTLITIVDKIGHRRGINPFIVIRSVDMVLPTLYPETVMDVQSRTKGLSAIPYFERTFNGGAYKAIYNQMHSNPCMLIMGQSGMGKTREMGEVAQLFIAEGFTVLHLPSQGEPVINKLASWPEGWPRKNLLICIDDLHLFLGSSLREPALPSETLASRVVSSPRKSFERRLIEFLSSVRKVVPDYKFIATVNSASDHWLDSDYPDSEIWHVLQAVRYELSPLSNQEANLFIEHLRDNNLIEIEQNAIDGISKLERNGSIRNIVVNARHSLITSEKLTTNTYKPTSAGSVSQILLITNRQYPFITQLLQSIYFLQRQSIPAHIRLVAGMITFLTDRKVDAGTVLDAINYLTFNQIIRRNEYFVTLYEDLVEVVNLDRMEDRLSKAAIIEAPWCFPHQFVNLYIKDSFLGLFQDTSYSFADLLRIGIFLIWLGRPTKTKEYDELDSHQQHGLLNQIINRLKQLAFLIRLIYRQVEFWIFKLEDWTYEMIAKSIPVHLYNPTSWESYKERKEIILTYQQNQAANLLRLYISSIVARYYISIGDFTEAQKILEQYLSLKFQFSLRSVLVLLGYTCAFQRKWSLALEYFNKEIALTPIPRKNSNVASRIGKAWVLLHLNQIKESRKLQKDLTSTLQVKYSRLSTFANLAWAALQAQQKKSKEVISTLRRVKNEKSVVLLVSCIPELNPYRVTLATELGLPEYHPLYITFRRKLKPRWGLVLAHPLVVLSLVSLFDGPATFSENITLLAASLILYLQLLTYWYKAHNYRLSFHPHQIFIENVRRGIYEIINDDSIRYIEEYAYGPAKFRIGYFDGKEQAYMNIPNDIDEPEKLRSILSQYAPIHVATKTLWNRLFIPLVILGLVAFFSPFLWLSILFILILVSGIIIGFMKMPSQKRLRLNQVKEIGILVALSILDLIYLIFILS